MWPATQKKLRILADKIIIYNFSNIKMMTSVSESVPEDILGLILEASSRDDFVRLSKVNTRFYTLLESQIYHAIE